MSNDQLSMPDEENAQPIGRAFDLAERTGTTSVGTNYVEADEAGCKKEFTYRISICRREARETQYWLRMIVAAKPEIKDQARVLWRESKELVLILAAIHRKAAIPTK
jgi:four helix bundle protein